VLGLKNCEADLVIRFPRLPTIIRRDPPGRGTGHQGPSRSRSDLQDEDSRSSASCRTFFGWQIAVELAEQGVAVFLGPVSEVGNEVLDLLAGGLA